MLDSSRAACSSNDGNEDRLSLLASRLFRAEMRLTGAALC